MSNERITRTPSPAVPGISDSVRVSAGDLLFVSGVVGFEQDKSVPADFARAVVLTLRELQRALEKGGASFSDLARVNIYITGLDQEKLQTYRRVRDEIIDAGNAPASTVIGVQSLFNGATIEVDYDANYPVTFNHAEETMFAGDIAANVAGDSHVHRAIQPVMGGEDFSYMLEARPGAFIFIGNGDTAGLHHPAYDFNDEAIVFGTSYWVKLVENTLAA